MTMGSRRLLSFFCLVLLGLSSIEAVTKNDDLIQNLPGLSFTPNFKQYSGYLDASPGNHLHYWLVESQQSPSWSPLVLWLNGGPGCSSLGGFFTELGPFRVQKDGKTIVENVNTWNKAANVLFLEAPRDVGFSYRDSNLFGNDTLYNDYKTANDNALAIASFFQRFPEYNGRPFYISGESYGGVYVPTLTDLIIKMIQNGTLPNVNLVGMAVGNGELSAYKQTNSAINLLYYRGMLGTKEYNLLQPCCTDNSKPLAYCDFSAYIDVDSFGNLNPKSYPNDSTKTQCAKLISTYAQHFVWETYNDVYNSYQDCYDFSTPNSQSQKTARSRAFKSVMGSKTLRGLSTNDMVKSIAASSASSSNSQSSFVDQGSFFNPQSTDAFGSFPCYMDDATANYLNLPEVRQALHIPSNVQAWQDCNIPMNSQFYQQQNHDMTNVFNSILGSNYKLRVLIYNGDVDMACNYQGDEWFIEDLAKSNQMSVTTRQRWNYTKLGFDPVLAGYFKTFGYKSSANITLLTVKGGGHFVPLDRPAPALQMITNFIYGNDFNNALSINTAPQPLFSEYLTPAATPFTRKQNDRIWSLPGLTYSINFKQYSGYLSGVAGNSLHYWFVESQTNPSTDPLVLWLNGGPGCSSLMGFLSELGPFHPNPDGKTLFENIYSWNKGANVLFLESPRNVGFSVQNTSVNTDTEYNDEKTAWDSFLALKDFFSAYPEYNGRPFYVTGESYGGVYVPTLTSLLIDQIQAGNFPQLNLVGMAVGNGELSALQQINSAIHLLYFHGLYGKQEWDQLQKCCNSQTTDPKWFEYCDFSQYISLDSAGNAHPRDNGDCGKLVVSMGQERVWNTINDVYNIYQDCYQQNTSVFGSRSVLNHKIALKKQLFAASFVNQASQVSLTSTDSQGGFQCYSSDAAAKYLNSQDVRDALHINPTAGNWSSCNDDINANYIQQHNDTGKVFDHIIQSGYPLRMMIYNGDVDMACNFIGDQWFVEAVAARWGMPVTKDFKEWRYMNQIAGYAKQFKFATGSIDLVTVKGAGHLVPSDRPGPALQMFSNFLRSQDLSNPTPYNTDLTLLTTKYQIKEKLTAFVTANGTATSSMFVKKGRIGLKQRSILRAQGKLESPPKRTKRDASPATPPPPASDKNGDKITALPGLTFSPNFAQYSGYLNATTGNFLHYWFVESQGNPSTDPLILWLNGGPGCSSIGGFLEELGPFHVNKDGQTLFENVFSWNKVGNVLFLESPRDVGYSYRASGYPSDYMYNDTATATDAVLAIQSFYSKFPEYRGRDFYITGESYGGVYVPTLTSALIKQIQLGTMSYVKLVGVAIGNGELSALQQINSAVSLLYFRGEHGKSDYDALSKCCNGTSKPQTYCDFMQYIYLDAQGNAWPKVNDNSLAGQCGRLVVQQGFLDVWETDNDVYNTFEDCYTKTVDASILSDKKSSRRVKRDVSPLLPKPLFVDQAKKINYQGTDANGGFSCFSGDSAESYMNIPEVRKALHIPDGLPYWTDCNDDINGNYIQQHNDTTSVFEDILNSGYNMRFLIYNGDVDMACQFLGDEWFIENLASRNSMQATQRSAWNYTQGSYLPRIGGYYKTFNYKSSVTFDLLTVKGGGHFVPQDRPGPALAMINNFVKKQSYSTPLTLNINAQPLLSAYTPAPPENVPRRKGDMIFDLPGATFKPNFGQHAGYLQASTGNYLHYWFVESQNDSSSDPIVLWMTGGPGCSSLGALLGENGPFLNNPDGKTLFENVYSWNKGASVLYLESPRGVGFSYQDKNANNDTTWDDSKTAVDVALALRDFFNTYPQFKTNPFYITGESYGGVYVPTVTRQVLTDMKAGLLNCNLAGMSIGNGMVSTIQDMRSLPDFLYFHGIYGQTEWDALRQCCPDGPKNQTQLYCEYDYYVNVDQYGSLIPKNFGNDNFKQNCANLVVSMAQDRNWNGGYDVYNLYQDCYTTGNGVFNLASETKMKSPVKLRGRFDFRRQFAAQMSQLSLNQNVNPSQMDPISTDNFGGFQCYQTSAATAYLSQSHVRDALNVPDFVQPWEFCKDDIDYHLMYNDTTPIFEDILNFGVPLRIMIYNGDVDTACGMFEAEWMIENLAKRNNFNITMERDQWVYGNQIAGYLKKFNHKSGSEIYLGTVKGAGHMVPTDRPGPALQLITNFMQRQDNYSTPVPYDLTRQPLLPQYTQTGQGTVAPTSSPNSSNSPTTKAPAPPTQVPTSSSTKSTSNTPVQTNPQTSTTPVPSTKASTPATTRQVTPQQTTPKQSAKSAVIAMIISFIFCLYL